RARDAPGDPKSSGSVAARPAPSRDAARLHGARPRRTIGRAVSEAVCWRGGTRRAPGAHASAGSGGQHDAGSPPVAHRRPGRGHLGGGRSAGASLHGQTTRARYSECHRTPAALRVALRAGRGSGAGRRHTSRATATMSTSRLDMLRQMVARNPDNALARFGLANELLKEELWVEAGDELRAYLAGHEDEGNGWGRLAEALEKQGRTDEAREALRTGIDSANRHGHPGMAADFEMRLEELDDA